MKNSILLFLLVTTAALNAQITVTRSHLVVSGQKIVQAYDSGTYARAASGTNMTWDFSGLSAGDVDSMRFGLPFWYEGYQNFPQANLAYKSYLNENEVIYLKADQNEVRTIGFYTFDDTSESFFEYNSKLLGFPSTYNSTFNESNSMVATTFELGLDPDSSGPIPFIDSIRVNLIRTNKSVIDGWGTVKTPLGNYPTLMQTSLEINSQTFDMKTSGFWINIPQSVLSQLGFPVQPPDSSYTVNFWTDNASVGFPLVTYNYSPGEDSVSEVSWLMSKPAASGIYETGKSLVSVYPNPVNDILHITELTSAANVSITDTKGREILKQNISDNGTLDLKDLSSGLYILSIRDAATGQVLEILKIVKE